VPPAVATAWEVFILTEADFQDRLKNRMGRYKMPKSVFIVEDLPRTASVRFGKINLHKQFSG
jgi:fatty-acyl-CoA synthase